jgi:alpha-1,3-mannosyltransferase
MRGLGGVIIHILIVLLFAGLARQIQLRQWPFPAFNSPSSFSDDSQIHDDHGLKQQKEDHGAALQVPVVGVVGVAATPTTTATKLAVPASTTLDNRPDRTPGIMPTVGQTAPAPTSPPQITEYRSEFLGQYLEAIRNVSYASVKRLSCPSVNRHRYDYLRERAEAAKRHLGVPRARPFFFALNLHQSMNVIPRLMASMAEAIRVLGAHNCVLSIVEGRSTDGSHEVLAAMEAVLPRGLAYSFARSDIDPTAGDRIEALARLRNLAVEPLLLRDDDDASVMAEHGSVIFFNDVAACPDDVLELLHQRTRQGADMTCAMDWKHVAFSGANGLRFYDVWISRTMSGESFFHIPLGGSWNQSSQLFAGDSGADGLARRRFERHLPFQVFACWNGGVVFSAAPLLDAGIRFRASGEGECHQGEVSLLAKDMWMRGYGRIAVVPSVNLGYDDETGERIQQEKGLVGDWTQLELEPEDDSEDSTISWQENPPTKVRCIPTNWVKKKQYFVPWDE